MGKTESKRHHWWPMCVSQHWKDEAGGVRWLLPDGRERPLTPANLGVIGNGHLIKLGNRPGEFTPWDQNFESEFQQADENFPRVISWLEGLDYEQRPGRPRRSRFLPQSASDELFGQMIGSLTSLAIRSPMTRSAAVALAERLRGPLPEWERNSLIAANMRDMHRRAVQSFGVRGKATAIFSPDQELIFGDGFYHNLGTPGMAPACPRILTPLTPRLAVLYAIPIQYATEPRFSTLVVEADEAEALNHVVQAYSREALFFRSERPVISADFRAGKHLRFTSSRNIVEMMVHDMPGVPPRDTSLDFLEDMLEKR